MLDPATGLWQGPDGQPIYFVENAIPGILGPDYQSPWVVTQAMAVEPASGDLYLLRTETDFYHDRDSPTTMIFLRRDRATGQETTIAELPYASWSMRFADARYVGP